MNTGELIAEILKIAVPCFAVLAAVWVVLRETQKKQERLNSLEIFR